jgi:hypothetical protein
MDKTLSEIWVHQIYPQIILYLNDLNWTFIISFIIVLYGVKHTEHYDGFNHFFKKNKLIEKFESWIIGLVMGVTFCVFRILGPEDFHSEYVSQYLRSLVMAITFSGLLIDWPIKLIEGRRFKDKP